MSERRKIAIIGGGITGLAAAYFLQKAVQKEELPCEIKLIEASDRLGGKIWTEKRGGFILERGADSFLARKEPAVRLAEKLGIEDDLVRNRTGQAYILIEDTLHKMPEGSFMGIPASVESVRKNELLSEEGKTRAEAELTLPPGDSSSDQSLGLFFRHRFGDELVENVIEPLISGVYSGDIDEMSLLATFPNFLELEQKYGSLIKGLEQMLPDRKAETGKTPGQFFAFKNGFGTLVEHLAKEIGESAISFQQSVERITSKDGKYIIHAEEEFEADAVIVTTPHTAVPKIFPEETAFRDLEQIPVISVANVALGFDKSAVEQSLDGTGFVVSRNSDFRITACTWTDRKWEHTTPQGKTLLRAYVGKPSDQEIVSYSDEEIVEIVLEDLKKTMEISGDPEFAVVTRWKEAMPQYTVGHKERIAKVQKQVKESLPGIFIGGSSYEGVGIPDCIGKAEQISEQVLAYVLNK